MDAHVFDRLTRLLAAARPRRALTGALAGSILSTIVGWSGEETGARKRRRKKKRRKKTSSCSCLNKACGQDNGCGGKCTVQAGCAADAACIAGACVSSVCDPPCGGSGLGRKNCQPNGTCACPGELKECPSGDAGCHECCPDAFGTPPDTDCEGSPKGAYCSDFANDGEFFLTCGCFSAATTCSNGTCGICCRLEDCYADVFGTGPVDTGKDCVVVNQATGEYGCRCRPGTIQCPGDFFCAEPGNRLACGSRCDHCPTIGPYGNAYVCAGSPQRCCIPTGNECAMDNERCCSGPSQCVLNAAGTTYVCA
jgi:hypothetical protein